MRFRIACILLLASIMSCKAQIEMRLVENEDGLVVSVVDAEGNAIEGLPAALSLLVATKTAE